MLTYLISRKHVPSKMSIMYFETWIDSEGDFFDTAHFTGSLKEYPFQGGECYLLLVNVKVNYHFPTITVTKMAKMSLSTDPYYSNASERQFTVYEKIDKM